MWLLNNALRMMRAHELHEVEYGTTQFYRNSARAESVWWSLKLIFCCWHGHLFLAWPRSVSRRNLDKCFVLKIRKILKLTRWTVGHGPVCNYPSIRFRNEGIPQPLWQRTCGIHDILFYRIRYSNRAVATDANQDQAICMAADLWNYLGCIEFGVWVPLSCL